MPSCSALGKFPNPAGYPFFSRFSRKISTDMQILRCLTLSPQGWLVPRQGRRTRCTQYNYSDVDSLAGTECRLKALRRDGCSQDSWLPHGEICAEQIFWQLLPRHWQTRQRLATSKCRRQILSHQRFFVHVELVLILW